MVERLVKHYEEHSVNKRRETEKKLEPGVHIKSLEVRLVIPPVDVIKNLVVVHFFEQYIYRKETALKYCNHSKKRARLEIRLKRAQLAYQQWRKENVPDSN